MGWLTPLERVMTPLDWELEALEMPLDGADDWPPSGNFWLGWKRMGMERSGVVGVCFRPKMVFSFLTVQGKMRGYAHARHDVRCLRVCDGGHLRTCMAFVVTAIRILRSTMALSLQALMVVWYPTACCVLPKVIRRLTLVLEDLLEGGFVSVQDFQAVGSTCKVQPLLSHPTVSTA